MTQAAQLAQYGSNNVGLYGYFASGGNTGSGVESTYFNGSMVRAA